MKKVLSLLLMVLVGGANALPALSYSCSQSTLDTCCQSQLISKVDQSEDAQSSISQNEASPNSEKGQSTKACALCVTGSCHGFTSFSAFSFFVYQISKSYVSDLIQVRPRVILSGFEKPPRSFC